MTTSPGRGANSCHILPSRNQAVSSVTHGNLLGIDAPLMGLSKYLFVLAKTVNITGTLPFLQSSMKRFTSGTILVASGTQ